MSWSRWCISYRAVLAGMDSHVLPERLSGAQAPALYAISLLVVFLCLAALYESWSVPFSVMLVVPLGVIGALLATDARAGKRCLLLWGC